MVGKIKTKKTDIDTPFSVGDLTYFNGENTPGTVVAGVPLDVLFSFTNPAGLNETFTFDLELISNIGAPDSIGINNPTGTTSFTFNGVKYTLELLGFSQNGGQTLVDEFPNVNENETVSASLFGRIAPAPVVPSTPEPTTPIGLLAAMALGGASLARRRS